jgi:CDP-diacylglycerol--glycerol-3-phosphate 3-phosphatidyltransferase
VTGGRLGWDEYASGWARLHGGVDPRGSRSMRGWLRVSYWIGRALAAARVPPGAVTAAGLVFAAASVVAALLRGGGLFVAAGLVLLSALADAADGAVAVLTGRTSRLGQFYDSVVDRLAEALWLFALWRIGAPGILAATCGALAWLHEYARARAAEAGMVGIGVLTVAERPTRVLLTVSALILGGAAWSINPHLTPGTVTVVLAIWMLLGLLGGARLLAAIRARLTG